MTLETSLAELVALAQSCQRDYAQITPQAFERFEELLRLVRFQAITAPAAIREAESRGTASPPYAGDGPFTCSVIDCNSGFPLFNIAHSAGRVEWRCLAHLPPEITFPIGLHGEEWEATGRPKVTSR